MTDKKWIFVTDVDSIPEKEGRQVQYGDKVVAIFNLGNRFVAIDNECPHKKGPLADGIVAGNSVFCPLHNLQINIDNGCAMSGGEGQVSAYPVKVEEKKIYISL